MKATVPPRRLSVLLAILTVVCVLGVMKLINHEFAVNAQKAKAAALVAYTRAEARFVDSPTPPWLRPIPAHSSDGSQCPGGLCGNSPRQPTQLIPSIRAYLGAHARLLPRAPVCTPYMESRTHAVCSVTMVGWRAGHYVEVDAYRWVRQTRSIRPPAGAYLMGRQHGITAYFLGSLVSMQIVQPAEVAFIAHFIHTGKFLYPIY